MNKSADGTLLEVGLLVTVSVMKANSLKYWQVGKVFAPAPDLVAFSRRLRHFL